MKKMLLFVSAFVLMVSYGYAQSENESNTTTSTEASVHGSMVSDLAQNATVTGKDKGILISSAARSKALTVANANARFTRGDAKPINANANAAANVSASTSLNGKPATLPPVTAPTMGQPVSTPVGKPIGVPVAVQGAAHVGGH